MPHHGALDAESYERLTEQLAREGITSVAQLLATPRLEILALTRLFPAELDAVTAAAAHAAMPACATAAELRSRSRALCTGLKSLDDALGGGLCPGTVTEVVGAAGMGKTQLCMQVAALALLGDPAAAVVYVDVERTFSAQRLSEMLRPRLEGEIDANLVEVALLDALSRVHVVRPLASTQLLHALQTVCALTGGVRKIALVVVDSVGALPRAEFSREDRLRRHELLTSLSALLKRTAHMHNAAVLVSNQVIKMMDDAVALCGEMGGSGGTRLEPSLGVTWAHNVNCRLLVSGLAARALESDQKGYSHSLMPVLGGENTSPADLRVVRVEKSPKAAQVDVVYQIDESGLVEAANERPLQRFA